MTGQLDSWTTQRKPCSQLTPTERLARSACDVVSLVLTLGASASAAASATCRRFVFFFAATASLLHGASGQGAARPGLSRAQRPTPLAVPHLAQAAPGRPERGVARRSLGGPHAALAAGCHARRLALQQAIWPRTMAAAYDGAVAGGERPCAWLLEQPGSSPWEDFRGASPGGAPRPASAGADSISSRRG